MIDLEKIDMILDLIKEKKPISLSLIDSLKLDKLGNDNLYKLMSKNSYVFSSKKNRWVHQIGVHHG